MRPTSMRMVVVFPAPFGPRKPKTRPSLSSKETLSTIVRLPMTFVSPEATSVGVVGFTRMRKVLLWYIPVAGTIAATVAFGAGFYSFLHGNIGRPADVMPVRAIAAQPQTGVLTPIIVGDSLARGTGDETG